MITNLSSFMKPMTNEENSLKGVVTPYDQKFNRKEENGFTLTEIVTNDVLYNKFIKNTFPNIQIMENGEMFMDPSKRIIQTLHEYFIKWIILGEDFKPSHDHNYPYVGIPKTGYLMKIVIPKLSDNPFENNFTVEYLCDINNIQTRMDDSISNIDASNQTSVNVDMNENMTVESLNERRYPAVCKLLSDKDEFIRNYLMDVFE